MAVPQEPDYGIDAPAALRNFFLSSALCLGLGFTGPRNVHLGQVIFPDPAHVSRHGHRSAG